MALLQINADLSRVAQALERIAKAVEFYCYPQLPEPLSPPKEGKYFEVSQEEHWVREMEEEEER
jgi:hypothetical protein